jgi:type II secretory pathway pseudopilin PulG
MRSALSQEGFFLLEVLMAIMILAVAFVALMGVMAQAMQVSSRSARMTDAISQYESFLFNLETGTRLDLVGYGGHGKLGAEYYFETTAKDNEFSSLLKNKILWKEGKEFLDIEFIAIKAPQNE